MSALRRTRSQTARPGRKILLIALALFVLVSFGRGLWDIGRLTLRRNAEQEKLEQALDEKARLEAEIGRLEGDSLYIEEIARKEYGMVREGEEVFRLSLPDSTE